MSNDFSIQSYKSEYNVYFEKDFLSYLAQLPIEQCFFVIDRYVLQIYQQFFANYLSGARILEIDATESTKSLEMIPEYVQYLVDHDIKRGQQLIAIGGGITQDICCFLSTNLFRGMQWKFYPTTLLAQADSCIGSKSSINCMGIKNVMGSFNPPDCVFINNQFLGTLDHQDILSGMGEIIKAHAIDGLERVNDVVQRYDVALKEAEVMKDLIYRSLMIKKRFIEEDEFDQGVRNIFNYGHSFGHAIEAATNYAIPHGVAVSIGMDMANFVAKEMKINDGAYYRCMNPLLLKNYRGFAEVSIDKNNFHNAISKDKKNVAKGSLTLILPTQSQKIEKVVVAFDDQFKALCEAFFSMMVVPKQTV